MDGRLTSRKGGDAVEVKDALTLMISFGMLLIAMLALVVTIVSAISQNKKK
ncbi:putative holin-like toxin [Paenibacillus elgii]|nr:putative holin-like toxin [Paenibacillus elgii]